MRKIKDRLLLAGAISLINMPIRMLGRTLVQGSIENFDYDFDELGAGMFLKARPAQTMPGRVVGFLANESNTVATSLALTYLLSTTGRDHAALKGAGLGAGMWVLLNGFVSGSLLRKKATQPWTPLISFSFHVLGGALGGYLVSKLGDDSLFPDVEVNSQNEKLPLVSNGSKAYR